MSRAAPRAPAAPAGKTPAASGLLAIGAAAAVVFLAAFAAWISQVPFAPGFDDAEHVRAALLWRDELRLDTDGPFVRVPLWQMLLGTLFLLARPGVAIAGLQIACVLATLGACLVFARRQSPALPRIAIALPLLAFALSPQALLYARHPVNELLIGALAAWVLVLGGSGWRRAPLGMGLAVGAAAMLKLSMGLLALPAGIFAWRGGAGERGRRVRALAQLALGVALVAVPCIAVHELQRGDLPLDNTSAYTLGEYMPDAWMQLGDAHERRRAGMQSFREQLSGDPLGYAAAASARLWRWLTRPATADFALFVPGFPKRAVGLWEHAVLVFVLLLAALGTSRETAPIWIFVLALPVLCAFPVHVPFAPKIVPVFACLPLATRGLARLLETRGRS